MSAQSLPLSPELTGLGRLLKGVPKRLYAALAAVIIAAIVLATVVSRANSQPQVTTQPVVRQTVLQSVTASGTVNAQNTITVGTQVSGTISELDVDFNSKVHKGQVLAKIDPSTFQAQVDQAKAAVAQAQAQANAASANATGAGATVNVASANAAAQNAAIQTAQANVAKAQDALTLAQRQFDRDNALLKQGYLPAATLDTDRSNLTQAQAAVAAAQAAVAQARAQAAASNATIDQNAAQAQGQQATAAATQASIGSAQATLQQDQLNLNHTVITSPVDGTVVSRAVSIGQTVAASLQTPTLFTIAQDLKKMEVDINVGEPDIGNVKPGDTVDFSVLAYPNQTFHGVVSTVRINPQTVNNVVTYQVIVNVNNSDGRLLPGMTANATINVASANNALVVPVTALHTRAMRNSTQTQSSPAATAQSPWGQVSSGNVGGSVTAGSDASLMVQRNGKLQRVRVHVTLVTASQAAVAPIEGSTLSERDNVVTAFSGNRTRGQARGQGGSPLTPNAGAARGMRGIP